MGEREVQEKDETTSVAEELLPEDRGEEDLTEVLAAREEELKAAQDKVVRLAAELDNFKKRIEREKAEHMKYALETFATELLPFLDNLERAVAAARDSKDVDNLLEGVELTLSGYLKTLERFGLKPFPAEGQRFDPSFHEALSVEEAEGVEENTCIRELVKGYTFHERVLRPAMVVVSKKPAGGSGQEGTNA